MRKRYEQISLLDTCNSVEERLENNKPESSFLLIQIKKGPICNNKIEIF